MSSTEAKEAEMRSHSRTDINENYNARLQKQKEHLMYPIHRTTSSALRMYHNPLVCPEAKHTP